MRFYGNTARSSQGHRQKIKDSPQSERPRPEKLRAVMVMVEKGDIIGDVGAGIVTDYLRIRLLDRVSVPMGLISMTEQFVKLMLSRFDKDGGFSNLTKIHLILCCLGWSEPQMRPINFPWSQKGREAPFKHVQTMPNLNYGVSNRFNDLHFDQSHCEATIPCRSPSCKLLLWFCCCSWFVHDAHAGKTVTGPGT